MRDAIPDMELSGGWLSAHLFFKAGVYGQVADTMARDIVAPIVERCRADGHISKFFFVRYGELGPHVRLRLRAAPGAARDVAALVLERVQAVAPSLDVEDVAEPGSEGSHASRPRAKPAFADPAVAAVRWISYEREIDRYGGAAAIAISESVFEASSDAALELLRGLDTSTRASRLGRGLLAMLVILHACFDGRRAAASFAHRYGAAYLRSRAPIDTSLAHWERAFARGFTKQSTELATCADAIWDSLSAGERLPGLGGFSAVLTRARKTLTALCTSGHVTVNGTPTRSWNECAPRLIPSHVHMTSNRLGLTIFEEAYLAYLIHWTLGRAFREDAAVEGRIA